MKTLVQCDFDGTLTVGEVSHILLEEFAEGDWKAVGKDYREGRITVEECNARQFAMVSASRETLTDFLLHSGRVVLRDSFKDLLDYGKQHDFDFAIISNGLQFYIDIILENLGIDNIEVFAAQSRFRTDGIELIYIGPDGSRMSSGFKAAYADMLRARGYETLYYLGDGSADVAPARHATRIFATDKLPRFCREEGLDCTPFEDLHDVVKALEDGG